ncbi:MAG: sigma-54 dependent transcriptional regulator [Alphaproteobacteria bacterium]|nr:sigma-54 dependent transcriptional regulator [Alphaproteobacteria bacterium]
MPSTPDVLIIEDTASLLLVYEKWLKKEGILADKAITGSDALAKLRSGTYRVTLLDLQLPDMSGQDLLKIIREEAIPTTVVVITSNASINTAVDVMRGGAYDFVVKPVSEARLITTTRNAFERHILKTVVADVQEKTANIREHGFIGKSPAMLSVYKTIEAVAASAIPIFITGESGTGKEVCATTIHSTGPRKKKPFVALNCAAIPKDLLESELFGHVKGAFSGATNDRIGAARSADGGTLFLDEICEMDISLQSKLLRFLQTGAVQPVGSDRVLSVDARILCATNKNPTVEVAEGRFREDLFYRLHVIPVQLPPLRDRNADIVEIAQSFLSSFGSDEGKDFKGFSAEAEDVLMRHSWPGNIRELQNVVRSAVVLNTGEQITAEMLNLNQVDPLLFSKTAVASGDTARGGVAHTIGNLSLTLDLEQSFAENERLLIEAVISECDGSIPKAAKLLQLSPSTIYRKREGWEDV